MRSPVRATRRVGVLNEQQTELAQFLTSGVDEATHRVIGDLPRGRGVLGALIEQSPAAAPQSTSASTRRAMGFPPGIR